MAFKTVELSEEEVKKALAIRTLEPIPLTKEDVERMTTDKWKACQGCQYLFKVEGSLDKVVNPENDLVYGCGLGQVELSHNCGKLPEQCRARNLSVNTERYRFRPFKVERNNCSICKVYLKDEQEETGKPCIAICEDPKIVLEFCPCKTCDKFMRAEHGCINETAECSKRLKYSFKEKNDASN